MLTQKEVLQTRAENYKRIREIIILFFYGLGVNIGAPSRVKDAFRILTWYYIIGIGVTGLYGSWNMIKPHLNNITEAVEPIFIVCQIVTAIVKLIYMVFNQHRFYELLERALTHSVLGTIDIFEQGHPINPKLKNEINDAINVIWSITRKQLQIYFTVYVFIMCMYIIPPNVINYYHYFKGTPNYVYVTVSASSYFDDKVMSFPRYHLHAYLDSCAVHICATAAFCFDFTFVILCHHSTGLIKVLCIMISRSTSEYVPKEARVEYMHCCIRYYQHTTEFINQTQQIFMHVNLSHFLMTMLQFGLVLYKMDVTLDTDTRVFIRMVAHYVTISAMCGIYCYNGQQFSNTSEEIAVAFNNCLWYDECPEFQKLVQLMILRTNEVLYFNISWFARLNYDTMFKIYKTSYSYFLLLRDISD